MANTLVVNFFAGPGTGKSTTTALTFGKLKMAGRNVEIAHEFAKDLTWEGRSKALSFQPYIIGKQMYKVVRLFGEVEAILTDSPILFGEIYARESGDYAYDPFCEFIWETFLAWNTLNIFIERDTDLKPYNPRGRNQSEDEALELDHDIHEMLHAGGVEHHHVPMKDAVDEAFALTLMRLHNDRSH